MANSTSLVVINDLRVEASALLDCMGRGPGTFSIDLWPTAANVEIDPPTHAGAHTFDDELAGIIASRVLPPGLDLISFGLTEQGAAVALIAISLYSVSYDPETDSAISNFNVLLESLGLKRF